VRPKSSQKNPVTRVDLGRKKRPRSRVRRLKRPSAEVSFRMSRIRSKDTAIELALRSALSAQRMRFRKHYRTAPGCPDVAFPGAKVAVFCDSSFWHGRDIQALKKRLRTNRSFWVAKIERNVARDRAVDAHLRKVGWKVLRFWEEDLVGRLPWCVDKIVRVVDARRNPPAQRVGRATLAQQVSVRRPRRPDST
jgi:DNA mismatch endonuclease, patch repair protein